MRNMHMKLMKNHHTIKYFPRRQRKLTKRERTEKNASEITLQNVCRDLNEQFIII